MNKPLQRSTKDKKIAGVCAGIAQYFGWDVSTVRIVYLLLTIFTAFCGVFLYLIMMLVMPESNEF